VRSLLAAYLSRSPCDLRICAAPGGKPFVLPLGDEAHLRFNLSHSLGLSIVALSAEHEVGADVEALREVPSALDLARRFFCPGEARALARHSGADLSAAFLRLWTRKEALLKAMATGLSSPLDLFEVSAPSEPARIVRYSTHTSVNLSPTSQPIVTVVRSAMAALLAPRARYPGILPARFGGAPSHPIYPDPYYAPLRKWLKAQNSGKRCGW